MTLLESRCTLSAESEFVDRAAAIFAALAEPVRTGIVVVLRDGEYSVNLLADVLDLPGPEVTRHLAFLCELGLVAEVEREGRLFFGLASRHVEVLVNQAFLHTQCETDLSKIHDHAEAFGGR